MPIEVVIGAVVVYVAAALLQLRRGTVPDWISGTVVSLGFYRWVYEWTALDDAAMLAQCGWAVVAALLVFLVLIFAHRRGWIGGGAAKLAAATPVLIGAPDTPAFLMLAINYSLLLLFFMWLRGRITRRRRPAASGLPIPVAIGLSALAVLAIQLTRA